MIFTNLTIKEEIVISVIPCSLISSADRLHATYSIYIKINTSELNTPKYSEIIAKKAEMHT